jgi:hypothetical protein
MLPAMHLLFPVRLAVRVGDATQALAILDAPADDDGIGDAWREPDHATEGS